MAKDNELIIRINGNIQGYKDALSKAGKETAALQDTFNTIAKTGAIAFAGFTGTIALATAQFAEFDNGLRGVKTLLDETSFATGTLDENFQKLSGDALGALTEFPVTLQAVNKSLFDIVSAGVNAEKAIGVLGSTSRLAVAGITSAAVATDGVTSALNAYGLEAEQAELVAAKFFTAQKFGKTTIAELSSFFGEAASSAQSYGVSLEELLAAVSAATTGGIKTAQAYTSVTAVLSNVAKPTREAAEEAERLGIEFNSTSLRAKGLEGFLNELTSAQDFNKQSVERLFGSVEAQKLIFSLTGEQAGKFKETLDALSDSQQLLTTFTNAYEEQSQSLKNQLVILGNNFQALNILVGANLAPNVTVLTTATTKFLKLLQQNPALAEFISKLVLAGTVTAALTAAVGLSGIAILKFRAALIASSAATKGLTLATKSLLGSTGLGLFIAFLPEIVQLLDNSLIPALGLTAVGFYKTLKAVQAATTAVNGMRVAIKGLLIQTGLGLLIAFLPEIIQLIEKFFGDTNEATAKGTAEQKRLLLQQEKDQKAIYTARLRGATEQELEFLRRKQELRAKENALEKIADEDIKRTKLINLRLLQEQLLKEESAYQEERQKERQAAAQKESETEKKVVDSKLEALRNENERIQAFLSEQSSEEIAFLKRRQGLKTKQREAEAEQDERRRAAALENVKLLNEQLIKEEQDFFTEQEKIKAEKSAKDEEERQKEEGERQKRIQGLKDESEALRASFDDQKKQEAAFLQQRQDIREQARAIESIKDAEEREAAIENLRLKQTALAIAEAEYFAQRSELRREEEEREIAIADELAALDAEKRKALRDQELQELRDSFESKEKIRSQAVKKEILAIRKENQLRAKDEEKFGKTIAAIKAFFRKEEFQNAQQALFALTQLQRSENAVQQAIGKAAALVQITIDTQRGATAAYSALAGIPVVGPALGAAAATAVIAYGAERAIQVQKAQQGGIVAGTGFGDRIPFLLEPGELITPRQNFEEVVNAVADQRAVRRETEEVEEEAEARRVEVIIGFQDNAADFLTVRQNEDRFSGTSQRIG